MTKINSPGAEAVGQEQSGMLWCTNVDLTLECSCRLVWEGDTSGDSQTRWNSKLGFNESPYFSVIDEKQLRNLASTFEFYMCLHTHMCKCTHTYTQAHTRIEKLGTYERGMLLPGDTVSWASISRGHMPFPVLNLCYVQVRKKSKRSSKCSELKGNTLLTNSCLV